MNDRVAESMGRLKQAGDARAKQEKILGAVVDDLASYLKSILPAGGHKNILSRHYQFEHWASGQYWLGKYDGTGNLFFRFSQELKTREALLEFAQDIADGWLDEVSLFWRGEAREFGRTVVTIKNHLAGLK